MAHARSKNQERLVLGWQGKGLAVEHVNWESVHAAVQKVFSEMAEGLGGHFETRGGKTETVGFLFTYRLFQNPGDETIDPVVVGITCSKRPTGIQIEGDISGEQTGDILVEAIKDKKPASTEQVKTGALNIARELVKHTKVVVDALADASRGTP